MLMTSPTPEDDPKAWDNPLKNSIPFPPEANVEDPYLYAPADPGYPTPAHLCTCLPARPSSSFPARTRTRSPWRSLCFLLVASCWLCLHAKLMPLRLRW